MAEDNSNPEDNSNLEDSSYLGEVNFVSLVLTLSSSAWVGLGKIADPISGEIKQDLKGVKYTIDLLLMLREKTRGNLTDDEKKILDSSISELQANFAETVFSKDDGSAGEESTDSAEAEKESTEAEKAENMDNSKAENGDENPV
jgi:hypothetical protein